MVLPAFFLQLGRRQVDTCARSRSCTAGSPCTAPAPAPGCITAPGRPARRAPNSLPSSRAACVPVQRKNGKIEGLVYTQKANNVGSETCARRVLLSNNSAPSKAMRSTHSHISCSLARPASALSKRAAAASLFQRARGAPWRPLRRVLRAGSPPRRGSHPRLTELGQRCARSWNYMNGSDAAAARSAPARALQAPVCFVAASAGRMPRMLRCRANSAPSCAASRVQSDQY